MYDEFKFKLGSICKNNHIYPGTSNSLRYKSTNQCVECHKSWSKSYSQKEKVKEKNREYSKIYHYKNREKVLINLKEYSKTKECQESKKKSYNKHRSRRLQDSKDWRELNKDKISDYNKKYAEENKEYIKEKNKKYRDKNKNNLKLKAKANREKNKEKIKIKQKNYRTSEKGRLNRKRLQTKREALKKFVFHIPYTIEDLKCRFSLFEGCAYCGSHENITNDHYIPISSGGPDAIFNIIPACSSCNTSKHKTNPEEWYPKQFFFNELKFNKIKELTIEANINRISHDYSYWQIR